MKDLENIKLTPSEFYKLRRPEYFSDSEIIKEIELPKETLAFELNNITTNQKENEFESLCRKLVEKLIAPNLIPQVGPTGGGDGKTDSETYPVSQIISDRWFISESGWSKDEKWAFAFSAKKDWKSKIDSDIKKIIETKRGYTRIYFITNQLPSSKKKKETQDELINNYKIDIVILDGKWILEKVYDNNLIDLVVDTLNLSQIFKNKKVILGKNDSERIKRLEELEKNISNLNRYFEYDFQLFEDSLESAIISRMIEKPRDEVEGRFDRTLRICKKLNISKLWIRFHYQRAWTYINYYDDYELFINEYKEFKKSVLNTNTITEVELFINLYNLLKGLNSTINLKNYNIDLAIEKEDIIKILDLFISNSEKLCSGLTAKTYKNQLELTDCLLLKRDPSQFVYELIDIMDKSQGMLDYPFESFKNIIEELGSFFSDNKDFDKLIDKIASISEKRDSELSAGEIFLKRGGQKLENKNYKDAVVYFGKAVFKLSKEESQKGMYLVLIGLGFAYNELGLIWASNNCYISSAYISFKSWYKTGKLSSKILNSVKQLAINELFIGRIPNFLTWHELFQIIHRQLNESNLDEEIPSDVLFDGCLTTRLLNTNYEILTKQSYLPDLLKNHGLNMSRDCILYIFGYYDLIIKEWENTGIASSEKDLDNFFLKGANQPFINQILYKTDFITEEKITLNSIILGCEVKLSFIKNTEMILVAETLLAFFESFFATSLDNMIPKYENIIIKIFKNESSQLFEYNKDESNNIYNIYIKDFNIKKDDIENVWNKIVEFAILIIANNFFIEKPLDYIKDLFEKEELNEKLSIIFNHRNFIYNILGKEPQFDLDKWIDKTKFKEYPVIRKTPLCFNISYEENNLFIKDKNKFRHNNRKLFSIINDDLWNKALWVGFGILDHPIYGFNLVLSFEEIENGIKIFDEWIDKIGHEDKEEVIKLSIIRGVNKNNPHWYRVHITNNFESNKLESDNYFYIMSRFHEMNAVNSSNIEYTIKKLQEKNEYNLIPAKIIKNNNTIEPIFDRFIKKREINILYAWEIGDNHIERVVIKDDDEPYIPSNIIDAPVLNILKKKK